MMVEKATTESKTEVTIWTSIKSVSETGGKSDSSFCLESLIEKTNVWAATYLFQKFACTFCILLTPGKYITPGWIGCMSWVVRLNFLLFWTHWIGVKLCKGNWCKAVRTWCLPQTDIQELFGSFEPRLALSDQYFSDDRYLLWDSVDPHWVFSTVQDWLCCSNVVPGFLASEMKRNEDGFEMGKV